MPAHPVILLFGMPRSGTTWLGKIFDSSPSVLYRHEPDSWIKLSKLGLYEEADSATYYQDYILDYLGRLEHFNRTPVATKLPLFAKNFSSSVRSFAHKASVYGALLLSRINSNLALPVISPITKSKFSNMSIAWKSIESLGRMGLMLRCAPNCKGVHIIRHPCGYIASVMRGEEKNRFSSSDSTSEDYGMLLALVQTKNARKYGIDEKSLRAMSSIQRLAWRWLLVNDKTITELKGFENYMFFRYEDLCDQPLKMSQRLFEFAGLSWSQQTEDFVSASVKSENDSYYSVFKNPQLSANSWREYLEPKQISEIEEVVAKSDRLAKLYNDFNHN